MASSMHLIEVRNRQRKWAVDLAISRAAASWAAAEILPERDCELSIQFLASSRMAHINHQFLQHEGATDVITFDLSSEGTQGMLLGEILICPEIAYHYSLTYHTHWFEECMRYLIHGMLHLVGYDDHEPDDRRVMKTQENHWLSNLKKTIPLPTLPVPSSARGGE